MPNRYTAAARWILLGLLFVCLSHAQINSGTITGNIRDATGAVIANANIVITNQGTNVSSTTKTTDAGQFTVPYLPAGTYSVSVAVPGFVPFRETGIAIATAQVVRVDVELKVGAVESAIEVSAQAAQIQTESSTVTSATQSGMIDAIPNIVQNPIYYAFLQAGVQPRNATADSTGMNSFGIGVNGRRQYSAVGINGGRAFTNDIQLD
jgi:hypothetical protein